MIQAPPQRKPRVFIACAGEATDTAIKIKQLLGESVEANVWNEYMVLPKEGQMRLQGEVMANLYKAAQYYDFVIVLIGGHDFVVRGGAVERPVEGSAPATGRKLAPRDNVLFEMGLFMVALGNRRTLVLLEPGFDPSAVGLPTDLAGHTFGCPLVPLATDEAELASQVADTARTILATDESAGLSLLPSTGLAIGYFKNFVLPVCEYLLGETFKVDDEEFTASDTAYTFEIVMPHDLLGAGFAQRAQFFRMNKDQLKERRVKFPDGRSYAFFVRPGGDPGCLHLIDYPTPLASSAEAVRMIIDDELKSLVDINYQQAGVNPAQMLETKEVFNFELTLFNLLRRQLETGETPAAREFPNRVRLAARMSVDPWSGITRATPRDGPAASRREPFARRRTLRRACGDHTWCRRAARRAAVAHQLRLPARMTRPV